MSERPDAWEERAAAEDREAARSRETPGTHGTIAPGFSRRSFLFFLLVAPAGLAAVFAILLALQYKQFQSMVSPSAAVEPFAWTDADRGRLDTAVQALGAFARGGGPDTLRLSPADLTLLAVSSPAAERQHIRFRITAPVPPDSLLVVESAQPVNALSGRFAGVFRKISPVRNGWLNARMVGYPEWKTGVLSFFPQRGFLNGASVPRTAMTKRAGLSPGDFIDPSREAAYREFLGAIDTVVLDAGGSVLIVRK
jgi:hypothetical protein